MNEPYDIDERWIRCKSCGDSGFRSVFRPEPFIAISDGQEIDEKYLHRPCTVACTCDTGVKRAGGETKNPFVQFDDRRMIEWSPLSTLEERKEMVQSFMKRIKPIKPSGYFECFSNADSTVYA